MKFQLRINSVGDLRPLTHINSPGEADHVTEAEEIRSCCLLTLFEAAAIEDHVLNTEPYMSGFDLKVLKLAYVIMHLTCSRVRNLYCNTLKTKTL